jgi:hypothetical protein
MMTGRRGRKGRKEDEWGGGGRVAAACPLGKGKH